jgi:hypothetical protein
MSQCTQQAIPRRAVENQFDSDACPCSRQLILLSLGAEFPLPSARDTAILDRELNSVC